MKINKIAIYLLALLPLIQARGQGAAREITFDDIYKKRIFSESDVKGLRSMNDGEHYTVLNGDRILKYSYRTGEFVDVLFSVNQLDLPGGGSIADYEFTPDDRKILVALDKERIYRHSYRANYCVIDLRTGSSVFLSENGKQQLATFSPDGSKVACVRENNLASSWCSRTRMSTTALRS